jgi:hypothetical protein
MNWHYGILKTDTAIMCSQDGDLWDTLYRVCEVYHLTDDSGHSGAVQPMGETVEELIECLDRMKADLLKHREIHLDTEN